jgi:hypothetical protein
VENKIIENTITFFMAYPFLCTGEIRVEIWRGAGRGVNTAKRRWQSYVFFCLS